MIQQIYSSQSDPCVKPPHSALTAILAQQELALAFQRRLQNTAANGFDQHAGRLLRECRAIFSPNVALAIERRALGARHRRLAQQLLAADRLNTEVR